MSKTLNRFENQQKTEMLPQVRATLKMNSKQTRLRNASEGNTRLMKPIANLDTFLQLANILTILLCGIAIALT